MILAKKSVLHFIMVDTLSGDCAIWVAMKISCSVVQVRSETWFRGKRDEREVPVLVCLDTDPNEAYPNTFDYHPKDDELRDLPQIEDPKHPGRKLPDTKALLGKQIELSVRDFKVQKGGRYSFVGKMVAVPLSNGGAPATKRPSA